MPTSDNDDPARLSVLGRKAVHGSVFAILAAVPIVALVTLAYMALVGTDLRGGQLAAAVTIMYVAYLIYGTIIIGCAVVLLGVPVYLFLGYLRKAHLTWMISAGFAGGCIARILWLGFPETGDGLEDFRQIPVLFATPGGLVAAAFWYGAEQRFEA